jgi:hypothetical protein
VTFKKAAPIGCSASMRLNILWDSFIFTYISPISFLEGQQISEFFTEHMIRILNFETLILPIYFKAKDSFHHRVESSNTYIFEKLLRSDFSLGGKAFHVMNEFVVHYILLSNYVGSYIFKY